MADPVMNVNDGADGPWVCSHVRQAGPASVNLIECVYATLGWDRETVGGLLCMRVCDPVTFLMAWLPY